MAGMPQSVIERANELLEQLEESHNAGAGEDLRMENRGSRRQGKWQKADPALRSPRSASAVQPSGYQLSFIQLDDPLLQQIKEDILNTDINTLTPVEALMKLNEIKKLLGKKEILSF